MTSHAPSTACLDFCSAMIDTVKGVRVCTANRIKPDKVMDVDNHCGDQSSVPANHSVARIIT